MANFSKYSNYKNNAGVSSVVFGADSVVLEVELNEMQEIQNTMIRDIIKNVIGNGITDITKLVYQNGSVKILSGCGITANGYYINCGGLSVAVTSGMVYLQVWEEIVDHQATLVEYGNQQSLNNVNNWFRDTRSDTATTKRKVVKYTLATSQNSSRINVQIANIVNGSMIKLIREVNLGKLYDRADIMLGSMVGVIGIEVDLENNTVKRVGDNKSWSAGSDYTNNSIIYGTRSRCAVDSSGKIQGFLNSNTGKYGTNITDEQPGGASSGALQFMVQQRAFYYKRIPIKIEKQNGIDGYHMTKWIDLISPNPAPGFKIHPAFVAGDREYSYYLIGENNGSICWVLAGTNPDEDGDYSYEDNDRNWESMMEGYNPMLSSVSLVKPMSGVNRPLMPSSIADMCALRGANWCNEDITIASAEQMLFAIEYATFNAQDTELGVGATQLPSLPAQDNNAAENPVNNTLGNGSGIITMEYNTGTGSTYTVNVPVYRGVKNPFGNINTLIDGIILEKNKLYWTNTADMTPDVAHYDECGFGSNTSLGGYISAFGYSEECDFMYIPTKSSGDSSKPVGDFVNNTNAVNAQMNYLTLGGNYGDESRAGLFCTGFKANSHITDSAGTHSDICARLCWKYGRGY